MSLVDSCGWIEHRLAMTDAIAYATARTYDVTLATNDHHFAQMPDVEYLAGE